MKKTISVTDFRDAFRSMGRDDQFTYEGLGALFEYIEELERDAGEQYELDVIALCCEWTEYADFDEVRKNYPDIEDIDDLIDQTHVIEFDGGLIVLAF